MPTANCQLPTIMIPALTQKEFELFRDLIYTESGINLNSSKRNLVQSRLQKRLRVKNVDSFTDYYHLVTNDSSREELVQMIDCISTNKTHFFREIRHFNLLNDQILPELIKKKFVERNSKLRIWSAACSSGEEAYTLAMLLYNQLEAHGRVDAKILATDISTKVLSKAIKGIYGQEQVKDVPPDFLKRFFSVSYNGEEVLYKIKDFAKDLVIFRRSNLLELKAACKNKFDIIFCRNVMIYFDCETRYELIKKYYDMLTPEGYLFLSHSETLTGRDHNFRFIEPAVYQK